jgi:hypothetical protein
VSEDNRLTRDHFELAIFNLAFARYPLDHAGMAEFVKQIDAVNRLAEASPGFVWTPADLDAADAATLFGSPLALANLSTWRSLEELQRFVYSGLHGDAVRRRREWFDTPSGPAYVLWWVPAGHHPDWVEAKDKLHDLETNGPTRNAFTFGRPFSAVQYSYGD